MEIHEINISLETILEIGRENPKALYEIGMAFVERKYYIGDVGINRRILNHWDKKGLLPYAFNELGWRRFSFFEYVWLKCIYKYRELGISLEKIKIIKEALFTLDPSSIIKQVDEAKGHFKDSEEIAVLARELPDDNKEKGIAAMMEITQFSPFAIMIYLILFEQIPISIILDEEGKVYPISFRKPQSDVENGNEEAIKELVKRSYTTLNLWRITRDIVYKEKIIESSDEYMMFLSEQEKLLLHNIRSGLYRKVTVKLENNKMSHFYLNKKEADERTLKSISNILSKGDYKSIEILAVDGRIVKIDETITQKL
ncbi:MAG: MerR family transcriptional regulator [Bacteroidetes bacterium]|nr:MerR family transcriptional regulator [Bacteroidota bacterium]